MTRSQWPRGVAATFALIALFVPLRISAQESRAASPASALAEALVAACRQNEDDFARHLTGDNAAIFRELPAGQRKALLQRFSLLDQPGRPLLSGGEQIGVLVRCESREATTETRLGAPRGRDNLFFIGVEVRVPPLPGKPADPDTVRRTEIGLVREGGSWKLLSVGLMLINLAELSKQWAAEELEARESSAINMLRDLARAIGTYRRAFGHLPESLAQLGPATKEGISPDAAGLVDADLAQGHGAGYEFRYRIVPSTGEGAELQFELAATPSEYGKTGRRSFFLDAGGTLRGADHHGQAATVTDAKIESR